MEQNIDNKIELKDKLLIFIINKIKIYSIYYFNNYFIQYFLK